LICPATIGTATLHVTHVHCKFSSFELLDENSSTRTGIAGNSSQGANLRRRITGASLPVEPPPRGRCCDGGIYLHTYTQTHTQNTDTQTHRQTHTQTHMHTHTHTHTDLFVSLTHSLCLSLLFPPFFPFLSGGWKVAEASGLLVANGTLIMLYGTLNYFRVQSCIARGFFPQNKVHLSAH